MRKKWKRSRNKILLGLLAFVCAFTQFTSVSRADNYTNYYNFRHVSFDSSYFTQYGNYDVYYEGTIQDNLPYGVITLRIPLSFYGLNNDSNVNFDTDYIKFQTWEVSLSEIFDTEDGFWTLSILSADIVGNNQRFALNYSGEWNTYIFDMSNYKNSVGTSSGTYLINDVFCIDVTISYQCVSGIEVEGGSYIVPQLRFKERFYTPDITLIGFNKNDDLYKELFNGDGTFNDFEQNSSSQASQLGQLTEEGQVNKIDIDSASSAVDSNIDLDAVGSSGVVLSALTGHQKILTMLLGVTAISLIAYVFFGKR